MSGTFLPYGRQTIGDDDIEEVAAALRSDFLTTGPLVEKFEEKLAEATGAEHVVACNSGTAALHLAALAAGLKAGDCAIVPAVTFLATANVVEMTGAEVVFADVDSSTGLMTAATLADAITRAKTRKTKLRAAFPVHLNGQVCDMAALKRAAPDDLLLIEDACHALGERNVGATGHSFAACFSFHPVKAIATAEGGAVTTRDANAADRMRSLRSHGMTREPTDFSERDLAFEGNAPNPWYYEMHEVGWNYRLPDVLCALGMSQLKKLPDFFQRRREIAVLYDRLLAPLAPAIKAVPHGDLPHGWHLYAVLIDFMALGTTRAKFMNALREQGIGSQVHYMPLHMQPYYRERYGALRLPGAEAYYSRCLSLPLFPAMTDADVSRVVAGLEQLVRG
jgi:UDP-4-amino-4,6-dideoxy-N-acetyl-beta-L-altrosamine transaminase